MNVVSWRGLISSESYRISSLTLASIPSSRKMSTRGYISGTDIVISRSSIDKSPKDFPHDISYKHPTHGLSMTVPLHTLRLTDKYAPTSSVPKSSCSYYPFQSSQFVRYRTQLNIIYIVLVPSSYCTKKSWSRSKFLIFKIS